MRCTILDIDRNQWSVDRDMDSEMLDHLGQYPDEYVVWENRWLRKTRPIPAHLRQMILEVVS